MHIELLPRRSHFHLECKPQNRVARHSGLCRGARCLSWRVCASTRTGPDFAWEFDRRRTSRRGASAGRPGRGGGPRWADDDLQGRNTGSVQPGMSFPAGCLLLRNDRQANRGAAACRRARNKT